MKVKLSDLEDAVMFTGGGMEFESAAYLDRETGKIYFTSDLYEDEEVPEDVDSSDRYLRLPDTYDLDLGKVLVFEFVKQRLPEEYERVRDIFGRRGAYGRFKDLLERRDLLDAWYEHESTKTGDALKDWCEEEGIELVD
jgi:hypothetical protein